MQPFTNLELYSRLSYGSEGRSLPVCLFSLFPHHHIKRGGVLVAEDEASIVIIRHRVHVECSLKVDPTERCVAYRCGQGQRYIHVVQRIVLGKG